MVVQAIKLSFPPHSLSSPPPHITSLLLEPISCSLALVHSDLSISLYPSISIFSMSSQLPIPQILIPSPSSSSTFMIIQRNPTSNPRVVFIVSGPYRGGSQVFLRFYILQKSNLFSRAQVVCTQKDLQFDNKVGVLVDVEHGVSIQLTGSSNIFTMYSISRSKIWVFAVNRSGGDGDDDDGVVVKLMRWAVIECCRPVWSISVSFGFLMLGEDNGVRVFNLRSLMKGRLRKVRKVNCLTNAVNPGINGDSNVCSNSAAYPAKLGTSKGGGSVEGNLEINRNDYLDRKTEKHLTAVKQRCIEFRQDSSELGACFVAFNSMEGEGLKSSRVPSISVKAISIQALFPERFLILDSTGNLHLLCVNNPVAGSDTTCQMMQFPNIMKVQKLAVFPDISSRRPRIWISDGYHSLHMVELSNMDTVVNENNRSEGEKKPSQISVNQAIFASETIHDVIPVTAEAILLLGQGSIYAYAIS